jgi:uncharacterized protein (DUF1697 family)
MKYVALLRGINVGGNNIIRMADLKLAFEKMGFNDVRTYIQSGNVIFSTNIKNIATLEKKIEKELSKRFKFIATVVVVSRIELQEIVKKAPKGFGTEPKKYYSDVIFLKRPLSPKKAAIEVSVKEGVDTKHVGKHVLYYTRLTKKRTQSRLSKIVMSPIYKQITIRSWSTTTKLLPLTQED